MSPTKSHRYALLCASVLALSGTVPVFAQLGQSDLISPGSPDAEAQPAPAADTGINPGKGWIPQRRFQAATPMMAPVEQQQPQQQMGVSGPQLGEDGSMPWQDLQRRQPQAQQAQMPVQQAMPQGTAFQAPRGGGGDAWSLPPAQQQMDLQWAQNLPAVPMSAVTPTPPKTAAKPAAKPAVKTAAKPGAKPGVKTAAKPAAKGAQTAKAATAKPKTTTASAQQQQLNGYVTQNANALQPTTQFDPNAGFPANGNQMAGMQQMPMQQMGGMQQMPMQQMPMQAMQQQMPMQQMPMQAMQQQMPMQQMMPMGAMQGMQQMPMQAMQQMPMQQMPMQQMPMQQMGMQQMPMQQMQGQPIPGEQTTPYDGIGKAIADAAHAGLIPSSGDSALMQNGNGMQGGGSMQAGGMAPAGAFRQQPMQRRAQAPAAMSQMGFQMGNQLTRTMGSMLNMGFNRLRF